MVQANLHITTLGHGYASAQHVDHKREFCGDVPVCLLTRTYLVMNLSHVITEFSFGPYFPDITQPLDNSFEITNDRAFLSTLLQTKSLAILFQPS